MWDELLIWSANGLTLEQSQQQGWQGRKAQALQRCRLRRLSQRLGHMLVIVD